MALTQSLYFAAFMCKVNNNSSECKRKRGQFMQKILICVRLFARLKYDFRILSVE